MIDAAIALREENDELRERLRQLTEQLASTQFLFPRELGLTPTEETLFRHLLTRDVATRRSSMTILYSDRGEEPGENNIDIHIMRLRRKIGPQGVVITNVRGRGWRIDNREALAARFK
ncbi:winged helix-turn-helix domain-containing protein [Shinella sp. M31]|uniref:winged helix-turn-helix domain-containing protein n=1 Tax=Shinella sp. M31 TaxID=3368615 RepID=UPI003BA2511B